MEIVLVGLNHRTAPVEVREKVSFTAEQTQRAAEELRARAGSDRASAESPVSRCVGSREAGAHGDGTWDAADVCGFRRGETGRADFWKAARSQGAGIGRGNDQRASGCAVAGSRGRTTS